MTIPRVGRFIPLLLLCLLAPLAVIAGIFLRSPKVTEPEKNRLRVTVINVGQGESSLIRTPGGGTIVIGAGPAETGSDVVAALESAGVRQIDLLILPYPFAEASGGVPELYESFEFKTVLEPGGGTVNPYISEDTTTGRLMREAADVQTVRAGAAYTLDNGRVKVEVLAPQTIDGSRPASDDSLVVAVSYGQTRFLFAGGIGNKGERALLSRSPNLRANWLRVARSGSAESSSPEFLRLVRPEFAVISVGPNGEGFPSADTLRRLHATGAKLFRTDQNGGQNITFWSDGKEVTQGSDKP